MVVTLAASDLTLVPATMRQLAMRANRAVLGEEVIQFGAADPVGPGQWRLSGLLRGRAGTEAAIAGHRAGEAFILLDGTGTPLNPDVVGAVPGSVIAAIGLGDGQPVAASIQLRGVGLRPPSPVHGSVRILPNGDHSISWVRRARGGWQWVDGVDVPLNEQGEAYEITYGTDALPLARWEADVPRLVISAAQLAALSIPNGRLAIRQRGDRALSEPLSLPFP